jgi:hypothetical protein
MAKAIRQYGSSDSSSGTPSAVSAEQVEMFHRNADTDVRAESLHHTLGPSNTQASPGGHNHDGGDSSLILEGMTISGSQSGGTAWASIIACLVRLGAKDTSTP